MLPINPGGHAAYQDHVVTELCKYYPDPSSLPESTWEILEKFFYNDLTYTDLAMKNRYSAFGPRPRLPSSMLRSYLLSFEFKITSITDWVAALKTNPLYAVASGFTFGDTPGIGTFYDFFGRLWLSDDDNFSPHHRKPKKKVKKPSRNESKAKSLEKETVEELLQKFSKAHVIAEQPFSLLTCLYKTQFLDVSAQKVYLLI